MHIDVVPMGEFAQDRLCTFGIVGLEVVHRLVGEHDAPAEGIVGTVALHHPDAMIRIAQFHGDGEIDARWAAADADDIHFFRYLPRAWGSHASCLYILSLK